MNRKPPELHIIDGTTPEYGEPVLLPENIKKRIPKAEWLDNPENWSRDRFVEETADFLHEVYGIGSNQDKHTLAMLADHIEIYIECTKKIRENGLLHSNNANQTVGISPYMNVKAKTTTLIIQLMNELGLTPRGRLTKQKVGDQSPVARILKGAKR